MPGIVINKIKIKKALAELTSYILNLFLKIKIKFFFNFKWVVKRKTMQKNASKNYKIAVNITNKSKNPHKFK